MATVRCILEYDGKQITKTFQIVFDPGDKMQIFRATPGLAIKSKNNHAVQVLNAIRKTAVKKKAVKKGAKSRPRLAKAKVDPNIYPLPPVPAALGKMHSKAIKGAKAGQQESYCFVAVANQLANFQCGMIEDGTFESYTDGLEFPTPP